MLPPCLSCAHHATHVAPCHSCYTVLNLYRGTSVKHQALDQSSSLPDVHTLFKEVSDGVYRWQNPSAPDQVVSADAPTEAKAIAQRSCLTLDGETSPCDYFYHPLRKAPTEAAAIVVD